MLFLLTLPLVQNSVCVIGMAVISLPGNGSNSEKALEEISI